MTSPFRVCLVFLLFLFNSPSAADEEGYFLPVGLTPSPGYTSDLYDEEVQVRRSLTLAETNPPVRSEPGGKWTPPLNCPRFYPACSEPLEEALNSTHRGCSCSSDCYSYGTCCLDARKFEATAGEEALPQPMYSCLEGNLGTTSFYVVSKCPSDWIIEDVKGGCETSEEESDKDPRERDPFTWIPVTSKDNNVTYRNVFCAACHGQRHLQAWTYVQHCNRTQKHQVNATATADTEEASFRQRKCPVSIRPPENLPKNLIYCAQEASTISSCHRRYKQKFDHLDNQIGSSIVRNCSLYQYPVSTNDPFFPKIYRNEYCAICNYETREKLACLEFEQVVYSTDHIHFHASAIPKMASFSLLIDMDFTSEDGGNDEVVGTVNKCTRGTIYDPFQKICRSVFCGDNFKYIDGICIPIDNSGQIVDIEVPANEIDSEPNEQSLISRCPRILLPNQSYRLENDTLIFEERRMTLAKGEYEILENSTDVLVCAILDEDSVTKFGDLQGLLTLICLTASLVCLLCKVVSHALLPGETRRRLAPQSVVCLSGSLFVGQFFFLVGVERPEWGVGCYLVALITHFAFLSSFLWSNVLAFDIWRAFVKFGAPKTKSSGKRFWCYSFYVWVTSLLVVIVAVVVDSIPFYYHVEGFQRWQPGYGVHLCWFSSRRALLVFFGAPLGAILVVNLVFFVFTAVLIATAVQASRFARDSCSGRQELLRFGLYLKLALLMNLTWIFGFVAPFSGGGDELWLVFIVFNGLQGVFVFLAFTEFRVIWRRLREVSGRPSKISTTTKGSKESSKTSRGSANVNLNAKHVMVASNTNLSNLSSHV